MTKLIEPALLKVGPYQICQKVNITNKKSEYGFDAIPVEGMWVLPGGVEVTTSELNHIASINKWKLG